MQTEIEALFDQKPSTYTEDHFALFQQFKRALNEGKVRSAEPDTSTRSGWRVNAWVKKGVLLGFRMGAVVDIVELVPAGFIPRTTSGKLRRAQARERWQAERAGRAATPVD